MKAREQRRKVFLPARMRHGAYWGDVRICNISSRGLLLQADEPPPPATYIEIRRGSHVVVGRTIWQRGKSFGVRTQDRMDIDAIVGLAPAPDAAAGERRSAPRSDAGRIVDDAERSRARSSALQYALLAVVVLVMAALIATTLFDLLGRPFAAIEAHLPGVT